MKKITISLLLVANFCYGQNTQYIGLKKSSVFDFPLTSSESPYIYTRTQIIADTLYVPTAIGIYRKALNSLNDTLWQAYAFQGLPIRDFVRQGQMIIANTNKIGDSLLLYSEDNGQNYTWLSNTHFLNINPLNRIYKLSADPGQAGRIIALHHYGLSESLDSGNTWTLRNSFNPEYQYTFAAIHPLNSQAIYHAGETGFHSSYIQTSLDNGQSWNWQNNVTNNCTHYIAFHPIEPNLLISGSEGKINRSLDMGNSWEAPYEFEPYLYIYKIVFDPEHPEDIYAIGYLRNSKKVYICKSTDRAISWNIVYTKDFPGDVAGMDIHIHNGRLIYFTTEYGLYYVALDQLVNVPELAKDPQPAIYPNPVSNTLYISNTGRQRIETVTVYNSFGRKIDVPVTVTSAYIKLDLSALDNAVYFLQWSTKNGTAHPQKIIKH
ncbi:MAG: T9SS type A sorting domain-containing protein [Taibaiella sp.]|nr:T9SS type A sorting domain-containing protein [Taibaiella sp.]